MIITKVSNKALDTITVLILAYFSFLEIATTFMLFNIISCFHRPLVFTKLTTYLGNIVAVFSAFGIMSIEEQSLTSIMMRKVNNLSPLITTIALLIGAELHDVIVHSVYRLQFRYYI